MTSTDQPRASAVIALASICVLLAATVAQSVIRVAIDRWDDYGKVVGAIIIIAWDLLVVFTIYTAWFKRTSIGVRWLCILGAMCVTAFLALLSDRICAHIAGISLTDLAAVPPRPALELYHKSTELLIAIMTVITYRLFIRWLIRGLKVDDVQSVAHRLWSMKVSLGIIALFIFIDGGALLTPLQQHFNKIWHDGAARDAVTIVPPIVLAIAVYKIGLRISEGRLGVSRNSPRPIGKLSE